MNLSSNFSIEVRADIVGPFESSASALNLGMNWALGLFRSPPPPPPPPLPLTFLDAVKLARGAYTTLVLRPDEPPHVALARPAVCSVAMDAVLLQGTVAVALLVAGLFAFTVNRLCFVRRLQRTGARAEPTLVARSGSAATSGQSACAPVVLPGVTVVMPCKGVHSESYQNWTSQVHSQYDGPLEFIFAVESIDDDAYGEIQRLIKACPSLDIKLVAAGLSFHCSQKIHNILAAVEMASRRSAYLVILDDDIKLHPCSFRAWVDEMEGDPDVFVATGYSFDWAGPGAFGLPTRLVMMWRMVSMGAFMNTRPSSVWGGALMFRREELHRNVHGIIDAWRDGGYSEDFILIALCRKHGRTIASPLSAIFLNRLAPFSWERYWNYVRRQVFVLFTWTFAYMRFMQILMQLTLIIHNGAGACAAVGLVAVVGGALSRLGGAALTAGSEALAHGASARDALAAGRAGAGLAAAELASPCGRTALFAGLFACVLLLLASVMKVAIRCLATLCNELSPPTSPGGNGISVSVGHVSVCGLAGCYVLHTWVVVVAYVRTWLDLRVVWSGVRFTIGSGRVVKVERKDPAGAWFTQPFERTLEHALERTARHATSRLHTGGS